MSPNRPHVNIGTIGGFTSPTLISSVLSATTSANSTEIITVDEGSTIAGTSYVEYKPELPLTKKPKSSMLSMLAMAGMMGGGGFPMLAWKGRSAATVRNDPNREKTQDDLDRLEAARQKRERKEARKQS